MTESSEALRIQRARSRSVWIATPMARHPTRQYADSRDKTIVALAELGIRTWVQSVVGSSNLPRARNELAAAFLASDYSDMLFIDDDMAWQANDVLRLLASDKPLIGGVGAKKKELPDTDPAKWCVRFFDRNQQIRQDEMGAILVRGVGTGFLKIERCVFQALISAHPGWKRAGWADMQPEVRPWYYRFFVFPTDVDEETGEDFHFCDCWRAVGGQVWIDPSIRLGHVGEKVYGGNIEALFI